MHKSILYCFQVLKTQMERLNAQTVSAYWKVSAVIVAFVFITSYMSIKTHEDDTLSRRHILKYSEMLRYGAESSIRASQDSQAVHAFVDCCNAKTAIDTVSSVLTPQQIQVISNIDIVEMQDFVNRQHDAATQLLLKEYVEKKKNDATTPVGGYRVRGGGGA